MQLLHLRKMRLWSSQAPPEAFHLLAGDRELLAGDRELTDYQGCNQVAHHVFCRHCGVRSFEWVDVPNTSGHKYFSINLLCLDGVNVDELVAAPVSYPNGRNKRLGVTSVRDASFVESTAVVIDSLCFWETR
jgi:hypothetical protein